LREHWRLGVGLQRAVDYLVSAPGIDPRRIIVTGHSRMGKAALLAAAFDERIALAIPHQAGCGGSAPSRARIAIGKPYNTLDTLQTKPPETVANINEKFPHWFNARFKEFDTQPERLPFDQNCLVALCAPRPVLFTNGRADTWINPAGQFECCVHLLRFIGCSARVISPRRTCRGWRVDRRNSWLLSPSGRSLVAAGGLEGLPQFCRQASWTAVNLARLEIQHARWLANVLLSIALCWCAHSSLSRAATGPIIIDPNEPHSFRYGSGERFFPMGDTAYYLIAQPEKVIAHYIDVRRAHKFNFIRMMAMADGFWPFAGTLEKPDYTALNEAAMRKLDWVFDYAAERGMNIELILWGYGVAGGEGCGHVRQTRTFGLAPW
jgi:hypothetical protein